MEIDPTLKWTLAAVIVVYLLTMVGLFIPLMLGLDSRPSSGLAANASMLVGTGIWGLHFVLEWDFFLQPWEPFGERQQ